MSGYETSLEWKVIRIKARSAGGPGAWNDFYKVWKAGFPGLVGYGSTLPDAIAALLNKYGE
jgi:hypothetical protein